MSPFMAALDTPKQIAAGQVAFIDYVVQPLFAAAAKLFPEISCLEENARRNRGMWAALSGEVSEEKDAEAK